MQKKTTPYIFISKKLNDSIAKTQFTDFIGGLPVQQVPSPERNIFEQCKTQSMNVFSGLEYVHSREGVGPQNVTFSKT